MKLLYDNGWPVMIFYINYEYENIHDWQPLTQIYLICPIFLFKIFL